MPLKPGDTFLIPFTGGKFDPEGAHLFICLVARTPENNAVFVPVVTLHDRADKACLLNVGDHSFIQHPSCVDYSFARVQVTENFEEDIRFKSVKPRQALKAAVLRRVHIGFVLSDEVEPWVYAAAHGDVLAAVLKKNGLI